VGLVSNILHLSKNSSFKTVLKAFIRAVFVVENKVCGILALNDVKADYRKDLLHQLEHVGRKSWLEHRQMHNNLHRVDPSDEVYQTVPCHHYVHEESEDHNPFHSLLSLLSFLREPFIERGVLHLLFDSLPHLEASLVKRLPEHFRVDPIWLLKDNNNLILNLEWGDVRWLVEVNLERQDVLLKRDDTPCEIDVRDLEPS